MDNTSSSTSGRANGSGSPYPPAKPKLRPLVQSDPILISLLFLHSLAMITTIIRLVHRKYIRRLWWDDLWAALSIVCDLADFVMYVSYVITVRRLGYTPISWRIASRWTTLLTYTTTLWTSRLTISVTITRLLPKGRLRHVSKAASILFGAFMSTMLLQKIFFCGTNWGKQTSCATPKYSGYMELATDIIGDLWLILAPAYILRNTKLRPVHLRLITAIFMCGFFTMFASIVHSAFILIKSPSFIGVTAHIQVTISIMVSNLLVLVTGLYRAMRRRARAAGNSELASPANAISTSETHEHNSVTTGATSGQLLTTEDYSHLTLTELTQSRCTSTARTLITLTELTDSRVATTQQSRGVHMGSESRNTTDIESGAAPSPSEVPDGPAIVLTKG